MGHPSVASDHQALMFSIPSLPRATKIDVLERINENEPRRFSSVRQKYGLSVSSSRYDSESETDDEDYEKMNRRQVNGSNELFVHLML